MPRKPLEELSPAYRRRIERGMAARKTRQEARGHKVPEGKTEYEVRKGRQERTLRRLLNTYELRYENGDDLVEAMGLAGAIRFLKKRNRLVALYEDYSPEYEDARDKLYGELDDLEAEGHEISKAWRYYH